MYLGMPGIHCGCTNVNMMPSTSIATYVLSPSEPSCFQCSSDRNPIITWSINGTVVNEETSGVQVQSNGILSVLSPAEVFNAKPTTVHCMDPTVPDDYNITIFLRGKIQSNYHLKLCIRRTILVNTIVFKDHFPTIYHILR